MFEKVWAERTTTNNLTQHIKVNFQEYQDRE